MSLNLFLSPQLFKPGRIRRRIDNCVLNVAVPKIVLNKPRVCPLIRQGKTAGMAEHVRMGGEGQAGTLSIVTDRKPRGLAAQWTAPLTDEESIRLRLRFRANRKP